ncbi:MAG: hypothetical protein QOH26_109 [Actinomycetota bacterium]|nr:hypothetical protein [Actinomycetota bacterium]
MEYRSVLADGTPLLFRPLRKEDKELLRKGFEHLSDETRHSRFFHNVKHLSEEQLRYLTDVDYKTHFAWVAGLAETRPTEGVGISRWISLAGDPEVAEVAVTVTDEYQRKGIGRTLLTLAMASAIEAGVKSFRAWILSDNRATLAMLNKMGAAPGHWESGVMEMTVPLPADPKEIEGLAPLTLVPETL